MERLLERFIEGGISPPADVWAPKDIAALGARWERAKGITRDRWLSRTPGQVFTCQGNEGRIYQVTLRDCNCPDNRKAPWGWCKHRIALWQRENVFKATLISQAEAEANNLSLFGPRS